MKMPEVVLPDFEEWALNALDEGDPSWRTELDWRIEPVIIEALKQAFDQGRSLGRREGYEEGINRGWAIEQDKEYAKNSRKD